MSRNTRRAKRRNSQNWILRGRRSFIAIRGLLNAFARDWARRRKAWPTYIQLLTPPTVAVGGHASNRPRIRRYRTYSEKKERQRFPSIPAETWQLHKGSRYLPERDGR